MLRKVIVGTQTTEVYEAGEDVKRGMIVVKDYATEKFEKADGVGVNVYIVDRNFVPTGVYSDVEISEYTDMADNIEEGERGILVKPIFGTVWATDQIDATGCVAGDKLIAGTGAQAGLLVKADDTDSTMFTYVGEYDDAGHALHAFEVSIRYPND